MEYVLAFVLGAILNRIRGGGHAVFRRTILKKLGASFDVNGNKVGSFTWFQWIVDRFLDGDTINAAAFGLSITLFKSAVYQGMIDGVPHYAFVNPDWVMGAFAALAMFIGAAPGWGDYIGALGGWRSNVPEKPLKEWPPIDKLIQSFLDRPKTWGFLGLTLRGMLWGLFISLALQSVFPLVGGALMGCCYWLGLRIKGQNGGWPLSELIFGGVFWIFCFI